MKKNALFAAAALALSIAAPLAQATAITRANFSSNAVTYNLSSGVSNGDVTISNGTLMSLSIGSISGTAYYDGGDSSVIRIDFANPVSAFGLDWYSNSANPTLSVYSSSNTLLESLTLDWTLTNALGFIGINLGSDLIAYATIDTPLNGNELVVDNLTYQRAGTVPAPATLSLLALSGAAMLRARRKPR
jgi:hypothetical protein